jgi:hypothetical protein
MAARKAEAAPRPAARGRKEVKNLSVPEVPRLRRFLWRLILVGFAVLLVLSFSLSYFNAQDYCNNTWQSQGVRIALSSSGYLSPGDTEEMRVTVLNERPEAATITVTLGYSGTYLCLAGDNESHVVGFGALPSQGRATGQVKVQFPLCVRQLSFQNQPDQQVEFKVWLAVNDQPAQDLDIVSLPVMSIPKSRTLVKISWSLLDVLAIWLGKELWDWLKEAEQSLVEIKPRVRKGA